MNDLLNLGNSFQTTDHENEQRRRLEQAALLAASKKESDEVILRNNKLNQKKQQVGSYDLRLSSSFLQNLTQLNKELQHKVQKF